MKSGDGDRIGAI